MKICDVLVFSAYKVHLTSKLHIASVKEGYRELLVIQDKLERHFRDMQDIEFTVERGRLYLLQTRTGKRTAAAAVQIANDMVDEGLIDTKTAVMRVRTSGS